MEESGMRSMKGFELLGGVVLLSLAVCAPAAALEINGTLENMSGAPLAGTITVIEETPHLRFTHHEVDETGRFTFRADAAGDCCCMRPRRDTPRPSA